MAKVINALQVPAYVSRQGKWTLYTFTLDSPTLDKIAYVSRREESKSDGYQRNLSKQRAADIAAYLEREGGVLPNNIIINFLVDVEYDAKTGILSIPDEENIAWIIDGQHRMFGLRQTEKPYDVIVTAFTGLSIEEQARQFKIINSKQKGVPSSLLYDLLDLTKDGTFVEQRGHELAVRLQEDPASPWHGMIDLTGSGGGFITQTRVVNALEPLVSDRGALFQYSQEEQYGILSNYFQAIRNVRPTDWGNKRAVLCKALGFSAFIILLPQVLSLTLPRFHDFTVASVTSVLESLREYDFSAEKHRGWAGHSGENRLTGELAKHLKMGVRLTTSEGRIKL